MITHSFSRCHGWDRSHLPGGRTGCFPQGRDVLTRRTEGSRVTRMTDGYAKVVGAPGLAQRLIQEDYRWPRVAGLPCELIYQPLRNIQLSRHFLLHLKPSSLAFWTAHSTDCPPSPLAAPSVSFADFSSCQAWKCLRLNSGLSSPFSLNLPRMLIMTSCGGLDITMMGLFTYTLEFGNATNQCLIFLEETIVKWWPAPTVQHHCHKNFILSRPGLTRNTISLKFFLNILSHTIQCYPQTIWPQFSPEPIFIQNVSLPQSFASNVL